MPTYEAEKEHILEILAQLAVMKKACGSLGHETLHIPNFTSLEEALQRVHEQIPALLKMTSKVK